MCSETTNERAAELIRGAMGEISLYLQTRSHDLLASAAAKLDEAEREDLGYLQSWQNSRQEDK